MNSYLVYGIIFLILLVLELAYFKVADKFNIIDKPNQRSSHSSIVLRGGGIIFLLALWIWLAFAAAGWIPSLNLEIGDYIWFLLAVTLVAGVSFIDDIHSLPDSVRLVAQFGAMLMMFYQLDILHLNMWWVVILADMVFCNFNFRPKGEAKCFAGDVGSIGVAYILLFLIGALILRTGDITWLIFLLVYGVDGCLTICHRIMLHENLGEAHRKHAYQIMANELKIGHVKVASLYALLQLAVSLGFIYVIPNTPLAHWLYLLGALIVLSIAYIVFMKKYYHLHEEYLAALKK